MPRKPPAVRVAGFKTRSPANRYAARDYAARLTCPPMSAKRWGFKPVLEWAACQRRAVRRHRRWLAAPAARPRPLLTLAFIGSSRNCSAEGKEKADRKGQVRRFKKRQAS